MLCHPILLMDVRASNLVINPNRFEIRVQVLVLPTLITLNTNDFLVKQPFNMRLKLKEDPMHIRFVFNQVDP
jgi:hypothetical protein